MTRGVLATPGRAKPQRAPLESGALEPHTSSPLCCVTSPNPTQGSWASSRPQTSGLHFYQSPTVLHRDHQSNLHPTPSSPHPDASHFATRSFCLRGASKASQRSIRRLRTLSTGQSPSPGLSCCESRKWRRSCPPLPVLPTRQLNNQRRPRLNVLRHRAFRPTASANRILRHHPRYRPNGRPPWHVRLRAPDPQVVPECAAMLPPGHWHPAKMPPAA